MTFIELFAGIGGFRLALERTGHKSIWSNEWLESPRRIYKANFGDEPDSRDIRTIDPKDIPRHELLTAGFPCATFSVAGKRTGLSEIDTRGTLFFEICRILRACSTPYFLLENVKGLLNHAGGRTFAIVLISLDKLGYDIQWEVLNCKNFGIPQNRERVFIVGNLRGQPRPKVFPIGKIQDENVQESEGDAGFRERIQGEVTSTIDAHYYKGGSTRTFIQEPEIQQWRRTHFRRHKTEGVVPTLTANMGTGGHNVPFVGTSNLPAFTYKTDFRKLTPLETERLQGLPDNFTKLYEDGSLVSDRERYERCGRTIPIPCVVEIGKRLYGFY